MDRYCMQWYLCFIALLNVKGTPQKTHAQQVCAYSSSMNSMNSMSLISCSDVTLSCNTNTRINILNATCGVRKYFENSCVPYTSKCYAQTSCCRNEVGDVRWPMADKHMHRLQQICSGKKQCHFNAPVHRYINYDINYCFVLYRCINEPSAATTDSSVTSTTISKPVTRTTPLSSTEQDTRTTAVSFIYLGIHGTNKSHIATRITSFETTPENSSDSHIPLSAVIVPVVVTVVGIVSGIIIVSRIRNRQGEPKTIALDTMDQQTIGRTSNQYDTISPSTTEHESRTYI